MTGEGPEAPNTCHDPRPKVKQARLPTPAPANLGRPLRPGGAACPYLRLARADRPIGFFLLAFPCFWSVSLAARSLGDAYPDPWLLVLFAIGAMVMRAAGCTYNDLIDRDIDAQVARTRGAAAAERPGEPSRPPSSSCWCCA